MASQSDKDENKTQDSEESKGSNSSDGGEKWSLFGWSKFLAEDEAEAESEAPQAGSEQSGPESMDLNRPEEPEEEAQALPFEEHAADRLESQADLGDETAPPFESGSVDLASEERVVEEQEEAEPILEPDLCASAESDEPFAAAGYEPAGDPESKDAIDPLIAEMESEIGCAPQSEAEPKADASGSNAIDRVLTRTVSSVVAELEEHPPLVICAETLESIKNVEIAAEEPVETPEAADQKQIAEPSPDELVEFESECKAESQDEQSEDVPAPWLKLAQPSNEHEATLAAQAHADEPAVENESEPDLEIEPAQEDGAALPAPWLSLSNAAQASPASAPIDIDWQPGQQNPTWDIPMQSPSAPAAPPEPDAGVETNQDRRESEAVVPLRVSGESNDKPEPKVEKKRADKKKEPGPKFIVNEAGILQSQDSSSDAPVKSAPAPPAHGRPAASATLILPASGDFTPPLAVQNEVRPEAGDLDAGIAYDGGSGSAQTERRKTVDVAEDFEVALKQAHKLYFGGQLESARDHYSVLIQRLEERNEPDPRLLVECMTILADIHVLLDEPQEAVNVLEKAKRVKGGPSIKPEKYLSALLKLAAKYENQEAIAEPIYLEAIKLAADELPKDDPLHERINDAYVQMSKRKLEKNRTVRADDVSSIMRTGAHESMLKRKPTREVAELSAEFESKIKPPTIEMSVTKAVEEISDSTVMRALNSLPMQLILSLLLFACGACIFIVLKPFEQYKLPPLRVELSPKFQTVDGLKVIEFKGGKTVSIYDEGIVEVGKYQLIRGNIEDLFDLLRRHMRTRTVFCRVHEEPSQGKDFTYLCDEEGRKLFPPEGPEQRVVKQMWWYAGFAQWHYKEKHCYPEKTEPWSKCAPGFVYVNPMIGKPVYCTMSTASGAANKLIPNMMAAGAPFPREAAGRPGGINCVVFEKVRFFVRGFDRRGVLICGDKPDKAFYIECTDGLNLTQNYLKAFGDKPPKQGDTSPFRFIIVPEGKELPDHFNLICTYAPPILWCYFAISVLVSLIGFAAKRLRWYHYLTTILSTALLLAWYCLGMGWGN